MLLNHLDVGEEGRIVSIEGGRGFRQKLALRGVREGSIVRVISYHGPLTVEVDSSMVSMGRGMASKIRVRRL